MPYAAGIDILADFQQELVGNWKNEPFGPGQHGKPVGGDDDPLSYNIMPLPAVPNSPADPDHDGYILKNFKYTERLRFNDGDPDKTLAIAAEAPNRGGLITQNSRALFYEQQVKFAEGPAGPAHKGGAQVVHVENGAWLWLPRFVQQPGPYPADLDKEPVTDALAQPVDIMIAKQIAVPHGNSILALGSFDTVSGPGGKGTCKRDPRISGSPVIPDGPTPYPRPVVPVVNASPPPSVKSKLNAEKRYTEEKSSMADFQNPHPDLTQCPNKPLQQAVAIIAPDHYMHWHVTTEPFTTLVPDGALRGHVTSIPFEQRVSDVIGYSADYWLLFKGKKKYLAYTQTIPMVLTIKDEKYVFPHITCNTVTYVGGGKH